MTSRWRAFSFSSLTMVMALAAVLGSSAAFGASTLAFTTSSFHTPEPSPAILVTVARTGSPLGAASVHYSTSPGTALPNVNYTNTAGVLAWANGDGSPKSFSIPILHPAIMFNRNKALTVSLATPVGAALGSPQSALVTLTATLATSSTVAFTASAIAAVQNGPSVSVTVKRTGGTGAATVRYATAPGTALAGVDYSVTSGTLSWAAGDASARSVSIPLLKTAAFTGTKSFSVALNTPTGTTLIAPATAAVTITGSGTNAAGTMSLPSALMSVAQAAGRVAVTVNRTGGSSGAVSVGYGTANGTAVAGVNYTKTTGVLTWASGDASAKTFSIPISGAVPFTGTKSFFVAIASPGGGAKLGSPATATVTISGSATVPVGAMGRPGASRLLMQGTFGATLKELNAAAVQSYGGWFAAQAALPATLNSPFYSSGDWSHLWFKNAVLAPDQLRQRMAFALSQILVVSGNGGPLWSHYPSLVNYYDVLTRNALGNYRTLLEQVTLSPGMGQFLATMRNDKADAATNTHADQNYARELMQLFTVGLVKLNLDGSVQTDSSGKALASYSQKDVENLSNVLTGWSSPATSAGGTDETNWLYELDQVHPMVAYAAHHDSSAKSIIGAVSVPAGGSAAADLKIALDTLFNHPNVGPFIGKQLIERLVTSNPSPGYVQRVASVFNNNGSGVRGDLLAVVKAILTDAEALSAGGESYGKLREPLLRLTNLWRAFDASNALGELNEGMIIMQGIEYFAQYPLQSPSVFNFYRPDYQLSGALTAAGMEVPEFQITNESTLVTTDNWLGIQAYQFIDGAGVKHAGTNYSLVGQTGATSVFLHTAGWEGLAGNPAQLVDQMNVILMAGQMPTAMRTVLINYANAIPASSPGSRVAETAELLLSAPQYAVQH